MNKNLNNIISNLIDTINLDKIKDIDNKTQIASSTETIKNITNYINKENNFYCNFLMNEYRTNLKKNYNSNTYSLLDACIYNLKKILEKWDKLYNVSRENTEKSYQELLKETILINKNYDTYKNKFNIIVQELEKIKNVLFAKKKIMFAIPQKL